jgi:hypothetical protein
MLLSIPDEYVDLPRVLFIPSIDESCRHSKAIRQHSPQEPPEECLAATSLGRLMTVAKEIMNPLRRRQRFLRARHPSGGRLEEWSTAAVNNWRGGQQPMPEGQSRIAVLV